MKESISKDARNQAEVKGRPSYLLPFAIVQQDAHSHYLKQSYRSYHLLPFARAPINLLYSKVSNTSTIIGYCSWNE